MHIHMATVGKAIEPIMKAINAIAGIDVIVLFHSETFRNEAESLKQSLLGVIPKIYLCSINPFDFIDISSKMIEFLKNIDIKNPSLSINITGGTNLMAAAACTTAFFIGAEIYYVLQDDEKTISEQLIKIPMPNVPNMDKIKGMTMKILHFIADHGERGVRNIDIANKFSISPQSVPYQVKKLEKEGLITVDRGMVNDGKANNREKCIKITNQGIIISKWTI